MKIPYENQQRNSHPLSYKICPPPGIPASALTPQRLPKTLTPKPPPSTNHKPRTLHQNLYIQNPKIRDEQQNAASFHSDDSFPMRWSNSVPEF